MAIGQGTEKIEISLREVLPADSPAAGDCHIDVSVLCRQFSTRTCDTWISASDWARFGRELRALEESRRGEALLDSQSPAGLRLRLYAGIARAISRWKGTLARIMRLPTKCGR